MAPRDRLIFWFTLVAVPFSILGAASPRSLLVSALMIGALLVVVLLDALLSRRRPAGLQLSLPPVIRLARQREGKLPLTIRNDSRTARTLRLALALPAEISSDSEEMSISLPADHEWSRADWPCQPGERGNYRITTACVEEPSRLGFWSMRKSLPVSAELRVYPDLMTERQTLGRLFLNRGLSGAHAARQVGKGREFEKLREYVPGDSYEDVHWKATARRGHPITKVFQIERTQEIYVVIDTSRLTARHDTLERYLTSALLLGLAAEQQGDLFGVMTFSDKVDQFVRARNGRAHYNACRDAIYALTPRQVNPAFDEAFSFIRLKLRRRAMIILLTALDDPVLAEGFVQNVDLISRQHVLLVNMMQPRGAVPLFSPSPVETVDDLYDSLSGHLRWHDLRELGKTLQRRGVGFAALPHENLAASLISQYLTLKKRQIL